MHVVHGHRRTTKFAYSQGYLLDLLTAAFSVRMEAGTKENVVPVLCARPTWLHTSDSQMGGGAHTLHLVEDEPHLKEQTELC